VLDTAICRHPVQRLSCHPLHSHLAMSIGAMWTANPDQVPRNSGSLNLGLANLLKRHDFTEEWLTGLMVHPRVGGARE
jgi:hypothetical protein